MGRKGTHYGSSAGKQCACCGKPNHIKAECIHRDKKCDRCGQTGHLNAACYAKGRMDGEGGLRGANGTRPLLGNQQLNPAGKPTDTPGGGKMATPWNCGQCHKQTLDPHAKTCVHCRAPNKARQEEKKGERGKRDDEGERGESGERGERGVKRAKRRKEGEWEKEKKRREREEEKSKGGKRSKS